MVTVIITHTQKMARHTVTAVTKGVGDTGYFFLGDPMTNVEVLLPTYCHKDA